MIEYDGFLELAAEIESQGISPELASRYASLLGDTPLRDEQGGYIVMDGDRVLAVLRPLKFYEIEEGGE